jgi:hypothetical protein
MCRAEMLGHGNSPKVPRPQWNAKQDSCRLDARFREAPVLCKPLEFEAFKATIAKLLSWPRS